MLTIRLTRTLKELYSRDFLLSRLPRLARMGDQDALAQTQSEYFATFVAHTRAPALVVTILDAPGEADPGRPMAVACANTDPDIWSLYSEHAAIDHTRHHNRLRGVVVTTRDFGTLDDFRASEIYDRFSSQTGRLDSFSVSYNLPNRADRVIRVNYDSGPGEGFPETLSRDEVEFFTLPFVLAWFHVFDIIDEATLLAWLTPLVGLTPNRLAVLRELICGTRYSHARAADRLGIRPRTLHNHYAAIHRTVFYDTTQTEGNASQMTDLMRVFGFLTFMGKAYLEPDIQRLRSIGIFAP